MRDRVGVRKEGLSEVLMEDSIDSVAETDQQVHGFEPALRKWLRETLTRRGVSDPCGRSIASPRFASRSLRESHAGGGSLYGFSTLNVLRMPQFSEVTLRTGAFEGWPWRPRGNCPNPRW